MLIIKKELLNDYEEKGGNKIWHIFYGKDIEIKTIRNDNSLKRLTRSEKVMQ